MIPAAEWEQLQKGRDAAHQFEPRWESHITELSDVGLGKNPTELLLAYLQKVGKGMAAEIRKDQRPWPDGQGNSINRRVATWEEAHAVCIELESLAAGSKAIAATYAMDQGGCGAPKGQRKGPCRHLVAHKENMNLG